jgi:hypothetical protein
MTDDEFRAAFENLTLPRGEWTHAAHVRLAFLYLRSMPADDALATIRERITAFNYAHGNRIGYHETVTAVFVRLIAHALADLADTDFAGLGAARPDLFEPDLLLRYYSRERLYSPEARARFVSPDVAALPCAD